MITESILTVIFSFVDGLLSHLPQPNIVIPANVVTDAAQYFSVARLFIPFETVIAILGILISLQLFRIIISLIRTIWALLPIV